MTLTLTASRNKKNYYKIYIDDEFLGCLPQKLIPAEYFLQTTISISEGDRGEDAHFIAFTKEHTLNYAQSTLLNYLAKAERTVYDCKIILRKHEIPDKVIETVIKDAISKKWLSDKRYAELYIEDAIMMERSPLDIKHKLLQKRIDSEIINNIIQESFCIDKKKEIIETLIDKFITKYTDLKPTQQFEKIASALYRKGFEYGDYEEILNRKVR